mgnify:CR=1 FL=1
MKVLCIGDSWTWGAELWDRSICTEEEAIIKYGPDFTVKCEKNHAYVDTHRWSTILSLSGEYQVENLSQSGVSNRQILEILHDRLTMDTTIDIIILAWTSQFRASNRRCDWELETNTHDRFVSVTKTLADDEFIDTFYNELCTAHWLAKDIPIINVNAFYDNKVHNSVDRMVFADRTLLDVATDGKIKDISSSDWHWHANSRYDLSDFNLKRSGHPDETGHKLIAQYIDACIKEYK